MSLSYLLFSHYIKTYGSSFSLQSITMARFLTQQNGLWVQLPAPPEITVSPAVLWLIVSIAAVFFVSGVLHILLKFFKRKPSYLLPSFSQSNRYSENHGPQSLGRQLQQLFRLQDSGLDQSFIDNLPVFNYTDIVVKSQDPFDCAVCLCEFANDDKLRLIPICSHAFHTHCIDTWLLSNSTCPLCRVNLGLCSDNNSHNGRRRENVVSAPASDIERVVSVRLGKLEESFNGEERSSEGEISWCNLDARRCFSMGSFRYVVNDKDLEVSFSDVKREEEDERKIKFGSFSAKFPFSSSEIQVGQVSSVPITP